ncbi:MAG TPA: nitroreductase family deazaflavin-dependent oxidoreductase [Actinomycetota bacterium]|nr:nitroreductase family deazaflavin-dependent oxidoreductase [Actinomycetota bacterium]
MSAIGELSNTEFCYLTTVGRASGRAHRIEIWFVAHADGAYLLSNSPEADWYRNLEAEPRVVLEIAGESRETVARAVGSDDPAGPTVRPAMVAKYQARYPQEDLREWSETASVVRIEWPM